MPSVWRVICIELTCYCSMWYTSFVFENTPVKKGNKTPAPSLYVLGQVGYTNQILCLLQEFWFYYLFRFIICFYTDAIHCVIHSRDKRDTANFPKFPVAGWIKNLSVFLFILSHTANLSSFSVSACDIKLIFSLMLQHTCFPATRSWFLSHSMKNEPKILSSYK